MNYGTVTLAPGRTYRVTGAPGDSAFDVERVETGLLLGKLHVLSDYESFDFAPLRWLDAALTAEPIAQAARLVRHPGRLTAVSRQRNGSHPKASKTKVAASTQERRTSSCPSRT